MKRIGIIGSRRRTSANDFNACSEAFMHIYQHGDWIVSGGCKTGGDEFAHRLHKKHCTPYLEFPANWPRYRNGAGFIRNTDIAEHSDYLIAVLEDDTGGAYDTVKKFRKKFEDKDGEILYPVLPKVLILIYPSEIKTEYFGADRDI